jgi:esterase/lipase superfamily enzyme
MEGDRVFGEDRCIGRSTEFELLFLDVKGEAADQLAEATLTLTSGGASEFFESYGEFSGFGLKDWLRDNQAFREENELVFDFLYTMNNGQRAKYSFAVCVNRSGEIDTMGDMEEVFEMAEEDNFVKLPIFFATDRNYQEEEQDLEDKFGSERSNLKYGECVVSVPNSHELGQIERPSVWKFEFWEDPEEHIVVHKAELLDKDAFFRKLSSKIRKSEGKSSFLFVHGYNVSFMDAARRTAQMAYDLKFDGEPVFYSWPSKAETSAYTNDEATIQWSKLNMERFLADYLERSGAEQVYLIAHSMGNRGLTRALIDLLEERPELSDRIQEIILAAPDIDADVFKEEIAPKMVAHSKAPITLYVSAQDAALVASNMVHGYRRAGDSKGGVLVVDGIETVDATGLDESFLGHSYFSETKPILDDIHEMIRTSKRAFLRRQLVKQQQGEQVYWKIKSN